MTGLGWMEGIGGVDSFFGLILWNSALDMFGFWNVRNYSYYLPTERGVNEHEPY
jgi:hypothetical protein